MATFTQIRLRWIQIRLRSAQVRHLVACDMAYTVGTLNRLRAVCIRSGITKILVLRPILCIYLLSHYHPNLTHGIQHTYALFVTEGETRRSDEHVQT